MRTFTKWHLLEHMELADNQLQFFVDRRHIFGYLQASLGDDDSFSWKDPLVVYHLEHAKEGRLFLLLLF